MTNPKEHKGEKRKYRKEENKNLSLEPLNHTRLYPKGTPALRK